MQFTCGGKIFIVGEYACIQGGPCILGTFSPDFTLKVLQDPSGESHPIPFAADSPAGRYLLAHPKALKGVRLEWIDPYDTPIGVGSSSAQFVLSVAAVSQLHGFSVPKPSELLSIYWNSIEPGQGIRPSGADVIIQWIGGPAILRTEPFMKKSLPSWKSEASFLLAFTGKKLKTHEHLKALVEMGFPDTFRDVLHNLNDITLAATEAWEEGQPKLLGSTMNAYQSALCRGGLAAESFTKQIEEFQQWPGVHGCKGSGAQGGDCILFLVDEKAIPNISKKISDLGWTPIVPKWTHSGVRRFG